ncbi:hypothetical protein GGF37_002605, partial [Kickxella alabastrina]
MFASIPASARGPASQHQHQHQHHQAQANTHQRPFLGINTQTLPIAAPAAVAATAAKDNQDHCTRQNISGASGINIRHSTHSHRPSTASVSQEPSTRLIPKSPASIASSAISAAISLPSESIADVTSVTATGAFSPPNQPLSFLSASVPPPTRRSSFASSSFLGRHFARPWSYLSLAARKMTVPDLALDTDLDSANMRWQSPVNIGKSVQPELLQPSVSISSNSSSRMSIYSSSSQPIECHHVCASASQHVLFDQFSSGEIPLPHNTIRINNTADAAGEGGFAAHNAQNGDIQTPIPQQPHPHEQQLSIRICEQRTVTKYSATLPADSIPPAATSAAPATAAARILPADTAHQDTNDHGYNGRDGGVSHTLLTGLFFLACRSMPTDAAAHNNNFLMPSNMDLQVENAFDTLARSPDVWDQQLDVFSPLSAFSPVMASNMDLAADRSRQQLGQQQYWSASVESRYSGFAGHSLNNYSGNNYCYNYANIFSNGNSDDDGDGDGYDSSDEGNASEPVDVVDSNNSHEESDDDCDSEEEKTQAEVKLRLELCQEMPFWNCILTRDTNEFLYTSVLFNAVPPVTAPEQPNNYFIDPRLPRLATPEIVNSIIEYLNLIYHRGSCNVFVSLKLRLPNIGDFIWRIFDDTGVDMWTALTCIILLRRYYKIHNRAIDAPHHATHELFIGIFMLATESCELTTDPSRFSYESLVRITSPHYQKCELVRIRTKVVQNLQYQIWINAQHIIDHVENNLFDIYRLYHSHEYYKKRQEQRQQLKDQEEE